LPDPRAIPLPHEGAELSGELWMPENARSNSAVIVMHTGLGIGSHVREVAMKLAAMGHAVLIPDMFGIGMHGDIAKAGSVFAMLQQDRSLIRRRARAWFDWLTAQSGIDSARIAAIGYCFGGQCVLELARSGADVKAAVSFHGLLTTPEPALPGSIKGEVVAWCAGRDGFAPMADIEALRSELDTAGASHQISIFAQAEHGFTDRESGLLGRPGISYDATADAVSWAGTLALLENRLAQ
jgi:dienelactone hydrolase